MERIVEINRAPKWHGLAKVLGGAIAVSLAAVGQPAQPETTAVAGKVMTVCGSGHRYACVVDGDTLWLDGQKIRLADINTPETHGARCAEERALGERATLRLVELINAGPFELVSDGGRDRDRYGRKLRLLKRDGQSLGLVLVAEGLAHVWAGYRQDWCA